MRVSHKLFTSDVSVDSAAVYPTIASVLFVSSADATLPDVASAATVACCWCLYGC
jgi:hypothetical protein